jgi:hypothetical protein
MSAPSDLRVSRNVKTRSLRGRSGNPRRPVAFVHLRCPESPRYFKPSIPQTCVHDLTAHEHADRATFSEPAPRRDVASDTALSAAALKAEIVLAPTSGGSVLGAVLTGALLWCTVSCWVRFCRASPACRIAPTSARVRFGFRVAIRAAILDAFGSGPKRRSLMKAAPRFPMMNWRQCAAMIQVAEGRSCSSRFTTIVSAITRRRRETP